MFFAADTIINPELSIHQVGNKGNDEPLTLSALPTVIEEEMNEVLSRYFSSGFKEEEYFRFDHDTDLALNEIYTYILDIFEHPGLLHERSKAIARHLYNQSLHPRIKGGELYVVYIRDAVISGNVTNAIGIFKSESRDTYLDVRKKMDTFEISRHEGINIQKPDKGCIIFDIDREQGMRLAIADHTHRGADAVYWKDDFLKVMVLKNEFHQTQQFLHIAREYVTQQLEEEFEVGKADKINLLNKSVAYFKEHEVFDKDEFTQEVFYDEKVIHSFQNFDQHYREEMQIRIDDSFGISEQAVRKQSRIFKSVLKLDKNFHIYIHGNREWIEQGVDENGKKFYKLFYDMES